MSLMVMWVLCSIQHTWVPYGGVTAGSH